MSSNGTGPTRKRKASGVILQRMRGHWDDEISGDGGKALLHRRVRHAEARQLRREILAELAGGAR